jgi:hypothetical protein
MKNFEISNTHNYKKKFCFNDYNKILNIYESIINEFINYALFTFIIQKKEFLIFILNRGIETLHHCFIQLFLYTRNLDLVIHHCKKAFYYYIEFIGQINEDTHSYLQLTSKDAILFVYKKTIFNIDNNIRRTFVTSQKEKEFIANIFNSSKSINNIIIQYLSIYLIKNEISDKTLYKKMIKDTKDIIRLLKMSESKKYLEKIKIFENKIKSFNFSNKKYILLLKYLIKKYLKKQLSFDKNKLLNENFDIYIKEFSELKFINWLVGK